MKPIVYSERNIWVIGLAFLIFSGTGHAGGDSWCIVDGVVEGSLAETMDLKMGDIIERINGVEVGNRRTLEIGIDVARGGEIRIELLRDGREKVVSDRFDTEVLGILPGYLVKPKLLSPKEMLEDLDTLVAAVREIHPYPHMVLPEERWSRLVDEGRGQLEDSLWTSKFWRLAARLVAELRDGRTQLMLPGGEWRYRLAMGEEIVFPLALYMTEEGVFVIGNHSELPIDMGDRLVSVNGIAVDEIVDDLSRCRSGTLPHFRRRSLEESFSQMIFEFYGWTGPFDLEFERSGEVVSHSIDGLDWPTYRERSSGGSDQFEMTRLPELRSTVIEVNELQDMAGFEGFLRASFEDVETSGDDYLVIDLRRSVGGNGVMAEDLLDYVATRPYRLHGVRQVKMSRYNEMLISGNEGSREGVRSFETALEEPGEMPFSFNGKVLVLTSNLTSGAAAQFAAAVKDLRLGTLIGEETGDPPSCWTDPYAVRLPNSGLTLEVSSTYAIRPNADENFVEKGVVPDVRVTMIRKDLKTGQDPWMEKAKELIRADIEGGE